MAWNVSAIFGVLIFLRILEHSISRANEAWLENFGETEKEGVSQGFLIVLQICFFISMLIESNSFHSENKLNLFWLCITVLLSGIKIWCMRTKGSFWNMGGTRSKSIHFIRRGPYKMVRTPEYWILAGELVAIPLMYGLLTTMSLFVLLHLSLFIVQFPKTTQRDVL